MPPTTRAVDRRPTMAVMLAALLGLALVAAMITRTSQAAFSATTDNTGNTFAAGTVVLTDNDGATALFSVAGMEPGDVVTRCIQVTYEGTITTPSGVVVYSGGYNNVTGTLSDHLNVTIDEGTGTAADCSDFALDQNILAPTTLTTFFATHNGYANGVGTWVPTTTPESVAYRVAVELLPGTPDTEQGSSTDAVAFVWEVQN